MPVITKRSHLATAFALSLAVPAVAAAQARGATTSVTATPDASIGTMQFVVKGSNPCGAVLLDYGDGTAVTYPIRDLPVTETHEFTKVGTFTIHAKGEGNCDGDVTTKATITSVRPQPVAPPPPPPAAPPTTPPATAPQRQTQPPPSVPVPPSSPATRFAAMDANRDGTITRAEWKGSDASFRFHDWNGDGRLSGDEVRLGAQPQSASNSGRGNRTVAVNDWSEARFRQLDRNGDNRITSDEWRDDAADFARIDHNGDGHLDVNEFLVVATDDDRGDRFANLDLNHDGRVDRSEWHGSPEAFKWFDRNNDGVLTELELDGSSGSAAGGQQSGQGGRGNSRSRGSANTPFAAPEPVATPVVVNSRDVWTDTGIDVRAGDMLTIRAAGTIQMSTNAADLADPQGARNGRIAANAPIPRALAGALIGRVDNSAPFLVGSGTDAIRATRDGRLYLGVNDDFLDDNKGEFRVTISIARQNPR